MNKNGFVARELVLLSVVIALVFGFAVTKVSFALKEIKEEDNQIGITNHTLLLAAEYYAKYNSDEFKEKENYIYGSDIIDAGFLIDLNNDKEIRNTKIKIIKEGTDYHAEVVA